MPELMFDNIRRLFTPSIVENALRTMFGAPYVVNDTLRQLDGPPIIIRAWWGINEEELLLHGDPRPYVLHKLPIPRF